MLIRTIDGLQRLLSEKRYCANGKNYPVNHLYDTAAESRWPRENLWGIYLTNPEHAWMALWMAVTSRSGLKKRHLRYLRPTAGDSIGRIEIYNPARAALEDLLLSRAYLYLFDPSRFAGIGALDLSAAADSSATLEKSGFTLQTITKGAKVRRGYVHASPERKVVLIDAWQVALVNFGMLVPDLEVVLHREVIEDLRARIGFADTEISRDYLA